jgi:precorrin-4/cobalt-precorrin-4 C11-methyltransferase
VPAFAAAAAALGTELTLPGVAQSVVLTRTAGRATPMPPRETLEQFALTGATLAIHLSIHQLDSVVASLSPAYGSDCPVAVVWRASWPDQQILRTTLAEVVSALPAHMTRTALIVVGPVLAAEDFADSQLYAIGYDRRFRPQSANSRWAAGPDEQQPAAPPDEPAS